MHHKQVIALSTKINPHNGDIDSLRLHFPVVTDACAWLSVRGRKRTWVVGEPFAFHDNDKHWAQHHGLKDRIVVILDYSLVTTRAAWDHHRKMGRRTCYIIYYASLNHD